ncbi:MAG: stage III sporulation AC/AD family protein [Eubacterium ramulus]
MWQSLRPESARMRGFSAIGSQIEMFAKFSIMAVSVPVLLTLLETIEGLLSTWK